MASKQEIAHPWTGQPVDREWNLKVERKIGSRTITRFQIFTGTKTLAAFKLSRLLETLEVQGQFNVVIGTATTRFSWEKFTLVLGLKCESCGTTAEDVDQLLLLEPCDHCDKLVCEDCHGGFECRSGCGAKGCRCCMHKDADLDGYCSEECRRDCAENPFERD